ncbi:D-glycerate dehydrogenase [Pontixanthobacter gangjinensis]|uniref:D-glycerate dehydrogenase n=1 Tax=Pontixanthobacter gangjinensis TaxID=1028742 RepID=A0A6I4SHX2_9SPHN|nr:D-glycerate dehydrogenase [Pontixanthobacter gangjinensis]MXO55351.1 D-glycerate dehydrogenase [Pontixanthobacter gangjinensis]
MPITIACSRPLPFPSIELGGEEVVFMPPAEGQPMPQEASIYLCTSLEKVDADMIASMPQGMGLIANLGIGYNNIDLAAAASRGIKVSNTPIGSEDTADLTFALILAACRKVGENERYLRAGGWEKGEPAPRLGMRVHGAVLGLVGFGAIGQAVARRATGFGMKILYHARSQKAEAAALGAEYMADLDEMLGQADIVSVHTALNEQTTGMIGAQQFAKFKSGAVVVNTARGPVIDQAALIAALQEGKLSAAGLDVFEDEPHVPEALLKMDQVVLTPHAGSSTGAAHADIMRRGIANITSFIETGDVIDRVPLDGEKA